MAIEGPVRELALSDLLQLLFLSRRTGSLVVNDDSSGQAVVLELDSGAMTGATGTAPETRLGRLLVGSGRATDGQIESALEAQRMSPGRRLGEILVGSGAVREVEIRRQLRFQVEEAVFDLLRWQDGQLRFEERPARPGGAIEIRMPTDIVLMDAVRRLDEWAEVTANAPDPDPRPQLAAGETRTGAPLALQPLEWEVLAKVDGVNTLKGIARGLGRAELDVARAIYKLASAGVVEIGGRPSLSTNGTGPRHDVDVDAAEAALRKGKLEEAARRIDALLASRSGTASVHVLHGRLLSMRGEREAAVAAFDRAIELDPLLPAAYFHLARTATQAGDFERAARALGTYRRLPDGSTPRRAAAEKLAAGLDQVLAGLEAVE